MKKLAFITMLFAATAQADLSDDLKTCAGMEDAASRLACFDALGRMSQDEPAAPAPPAAPATPSEAPAIDEKSGQFGMDSMTSREREQIEMEERLAADAEKALAEDERKALKAAEKKAEKARKKKEKEQLVTATITRVVRHSDTRFSVTLDNGQVWRETMGTRVGTPKVGAAVELKRGRFGGYRMKIDGIPSTAWVKRTK